MLDGKAPGVFPHKPDDLMREDLLVEIEAVALVKT